jgi:hypothetical protein
MCVFIFTHTVFLKKLWGAKGASIEKQGVTEIYGMQKRGAKGAKYYI